jgi:small nuclear ribonucleoprotein (snRNP)-like protein
MNMILENAYEIWTQMPKKGKGKKAKPINRERYISKLFRRIYKNHWKFDIFVQQKQI